MPSDADSSDLGDPTFAASAVLEPGPGHSPESLRRAVLAGLSGPPRDIVLDLRTVDRMTNPDVAVLVGARARQRARQRRLTLLFERHSVTDQALGRAGLRGSFTTALVSESVVDLSRPVAGSDERS